MMFRSIGALLVLTVGMLLSGAAFSMQKPLMVIRFYQPTVQYETSLSMAMKQALQANPQMQFDVVAVYPNRAQSRESAVHYGQQVMQQMQHMHVPMQQIFFHQQANDGVTSPEIQIFVR